MKRMSYGSFRRSRYWLNSRDYGVLQDAKESGASSRELYRLANTIHSGTGNSALAARIRGVADAKRRRGL